MTRIVMSSLTAIVVLSASVSLGVEQTQGTYAGTGDHIWLQRGTLSSDVTQNLSLFTGQQMDGAVQTFLTTINRVAYASSEGAEVGVLDSMEVTGWQGQMLGGPVGPKREDQTYGLHGLLSLGVNSGVGAASALQLISLAGNQTAMDLAGALTASATTIGMQKGELDGFVNGLNGVEMTMYANTVQSQVNPHSE